MDTLFHRFQDKIKGVLEGFDRIVFKGTLRPLCFALGMQTFLSNQGVLNKNYKEWMHNTSSAIITDAEEYAKKQNVADMLYLPSWHIRKEEQAHEQQKKLEIQTGLIGVWSCVESCHTFKAVFDKTRGFPQIKPENSRCKHLYFYYDHKDYGWKKI